MSIWVVSRVLLRLDEYAKGRSRAVPLMSDFPVTETGR
ncbi:hypothetical protein Rrhod_1411 [Rhodococcus rhodnii LMG 5362]|uniref:Uncharacterized protein n=1 Tax=Rhodococcus rhodnii LMG 5362 TaxID=1273125 RepID=R7WPC2_9NOCA|nr:hypothetical protein Rrhod_1411 [Rhodococcus rhodnii LMG 5362]